MKYSVITINYINKGFHIGTGKSTTMREFVDFVGDVYDGNNINLGGRPYRECDIKKKTCTNYYMYKFINVEQYG